MRKSLLIIIVTIQCCVCCSCDNSQNAKVAKGKAQGAPYELLVVGEKDWLKTTSGSTLIELLESDIPGLPQAEKRFRVMTVNPNGFNKRFQAFSNIIIVDRLTRKDKREIGVNVLRDVYAKGQVILTITFQSDSDFVRLIEQNQQHILQTFVNETLHRKMTYLKSHHSKMVYDQVKKQFGYEAFVSADINSFKKGKDFLWASSMKRDNMLNFCIYTCNVDVTIDELTAERFVARRDSVMKINIPGEREGQYMTTGRMGVVSEMKKMNGKMVQMVRGLWEMQNDALGGPFVSYAWIDSVGKNVIVAEGFVLAPEKHKRDLMGDMEAAVRSVVL